MLTEANIQKNDIVIYFDEWNTGSNFNAICETINKFLPHGAFFLPMAVLSPNAISHERWDDFQRDHDLLLRTWGNAIPDFRKVLPPLPTTISPNLYFFWSENDRFSGFRKMQVHGSFFSSLDYAIEQLKQDEALLEDTLSIMVAEASKTLEPPKEMFEKGYLLKKIFYEAYTDYQQCKKQISDSVEERAKGGETDDFDEEMKTSLNAYSAITKGRPADFAIMAATFCLHRLGSIDPVNQYHYKNHAPFLIPLVGRMALPHTTILKHLRSRLEFLKSSNETRA